MKKTKKVEKVIEAYFKKPMVDPKKAYRERNMMTDAVSEGCHGVAMFDPNTSTNIPKGGPVGGQ